MTNELQVIVQESGLEQTKATFILEKFQDYFKIASEWEQKAKAIVVTDEKQTVDMAMARTGRLFLREKRIAIEKARKELKEQALREGKAIDGIANVLKALIEPIEEYLDRQEHFIEHKQAAEAELARLEAEKKLEEERTAKENEEKAEQERIRLENEKLKAEAILKEKALEKERQEQAKILSDEKAKAEAERKAIEEKNRLEREKEAKERAIVEAELKAKAEAERVALQAKRKAEEELKQMIECPHCHKTFKLK